LTLESNFNSTERQVVLGDSYFGVVSGDDNAVDLGRSVARYKDLYLSGGLFVGGTGSANKLDDYEEGTFSPQYGNDDNTVRSGSYVKQEGRYTKIGRMVFLYIRLRSNGIATTTGQVTITPLPFVAADIESNHGGASIGFTSNWGSNHPNQALVRENDDYLLLYHRYSATGGTTAIDQGDLNSGSDNNNIHIIVWYESAS
jgi:hypothetical protein